MEFFLRKKFTYIYGIHNVPLYIVSSKKSTSHFKEFMKSTTIVENPKSRPRYFGMLLASSHEYIEDVKCMHVMVINPYLLNS